MSKRKFSVNEKKSYKAGFLKGLRFGSRRKKTKVSTKEDKYLMNLASRYASHMGHKFGLTEEEIRNNALNHFKQAKSDFEYKNFLIREYGD